MKAERRPIQAGSHSADGWLDVFGLRRSMTLAALLPGQFPLVLRDAALLDRSAGADCRYLLLGSIATAKYTEPLLNVFGDRLLFPVEFVGRGDMSRGGLMLRRAHSGEELSYASLRGAVRQGPRCPPMDGFGCPPRRTPPCQVGAMAEAVILVGLPGAGKSTYYKTHLAKTHTLVSGDVHGSNRNQMLALDACIQNTLSFAVDNTNVTRATRAPFIRRAQNAGYRVMCYFFDTPVRTAIGRNNHRKDKKAIPVPASLKSAKQLQPPAIEEGFDKIDVIQAVAGSNSSSRLRLFRPLGRATAGLGAGLNPAPRPNSAGRPRESGG